MYQEYWKYETIIFKGRVIISVTGHKKILQINEQIAKWINKEQLKYKKIEIINIKITFLSIYENEHSIGYIHIIKK